MMTVQRPLFDMENIIEPLNGSGPRARRSDAITSHEAADSTQSAIAASQDFVLDMLWLHGALPDFRLAELSVSENAHFSPSRIRTARHELVESGRVRLSDKEARTPSGRRAQVWEATR